MAKDIAEFSKLLDEVIELEKDIVLAVTNGNVEKYGKAFEEQYRKKLILNQMYKELN